MAEDKHGFKIQEYPNPLETVRKSLENCEQLCGLDKKTVETLLKGEFHQYETLNSVGRSSKKIIIEYDIQQKKDDCTLLTKEGRKFNKDCLRYYKGVCS